jgi:ubiquinone/menaquinone biosynthesis C-methylase UbiE
MKENHADVVRKQFSKQAPRFGETGRPLASREYLDWMVTNLDLEPHWRVLDVAAGTGHLGRAIAPHVRRVVAVDITSQMLNAGVRQAEEDCISNIIFEQSLAEQVPHPNDTFDIVVSRFAIHHFEHPSIPITEMVRVCRLGGRVAVIDLVSPDDDTLAATYNRLEHLRDPSHTRALSVRKLKGLLKDAGLKIIQTISCEVDVNVDHWLDLAQTEPEVRRMIVDELTEELGGSKPSGMRPFLRDNELMFEQTWLIVVGEK